MKEIILGSRNFSNFFIINLLALAGGGFFLTGWASYFQKNFFLLSEASKIPFFPQGLTLLFYGSGALGFATYLSLTFFWDIGSGYNEFSTEEKLVRLVRKGFPGKNRMIFLSYDFQTIKKLKFLRKEGLNPRCNLLLVLKDKREIPLFPPQTFFQPSEMEKKALQLSKILNVPLESLQV